MATRTKSHKGGRSASTATRKPTPAVRKSAASKTRSAGAAGKSARKSDEAIDVVKLLDTLGVKPEMLDTMVGNWKNQLSNKVTTKIEEADLRDAFDRAKELADGSVDRVKDYSKKNPAMFFSGLAAVLMGAGLLAAAGRKSDDE